MPQASHDIVCSAASVVDFFTFSSVQGSCRWADRAAMRLSSLHTSCVSFHMPRRFGMAGLSAQNSNVFTNNLRKTLEAHRSSNRAGLIRKTYPTTPAAGLFRPYIPPENRAGYRPSDSPPASQEFETKSSRRKRPARIKPDNSTSLAQHQSSEHHIRGAGRLPEQQPWLRCQGPIANTGDAAAYLASEIQALDRYLAPTAAEQDRINQLSTEVVSILEKVVPQPPQLIGSRRTGFALPHSDLNFLLPFEDPKRTLFLARRPSATRPQIQEDHRNQIRRVQSTLQSSMLFRDQVQLVGKRKLVLQARHRPTGLLLQFQCGEAIPALTEHLQDYLVEYPVLRPLYTATRTLLEARELFGVRKANIGSDTLAILIVAFLKINHGRFLSLHRLGDQFVALLRFYSTEIDLQSVGIAVDPPGVFEARTLPTPAKAGEPAYLRGQRALLKARRTAALNRDLRLRGRLCVQDPTHYGNDLGKWCHRTAELQSAFAAAYASLVHACSNWQGPRRDRSILTAALKANFGEIENLRSQLVRTM